MRTTTMNIVETDDQLCVCVCIEERMRTTRKQEMDEENKELGEDEKPQQE